MPRKEGPPLEERMQRAKELAELKAIKRQELLQQLYASRLYRYARKSCIAFLWVSQLMLIDWALPYLEERDKISGGYFNSNTITTQGVGGITDYKLKELFIKTHGGYKFTLDFEGHETEPSIGDSIIIYKSFLFHDFKKLSVPRIKESYFIANAVTYRYLPFFFIVSALSIAFIFIRNIEVKAFAWISLICTAIFGIFLVVYMVMSFQ